jgi:hypothetical protein
MGDTLGNILIAVVLGAGILALLLRAWHRWNPDGSPGHYFRYRGSQPGTPHFDAIQRDKAP